jgi:hypothetical protein
MAFMYNVSPQFLDATGTPYAGGKLYFGEPNVDPIQNPQTIYLDEALTVEADNPQTLDARGVPAQGSIYMLGGASKYSVMLIDANGNQVFNVPNAIGVTLSADLNNIPAITVIDTITVTSATSANVVINSGVAADSEGSTDYQEGGILQWQWVRKAIIDGGAMLLRRVTGAGSPDEPLEFPVVGGLIAKWLGTDRIRVESDGVAILGAIKNTNQVLIAGGTYLHSGAAVGVTEGISSAGNTGTGEYTVILDFTPTDEANLLVEASAYDATGLMLARGVGGGTPGTVIVYTGPTNAALADATSFTVSVFDLGRS